MPAFNERGDVIHNNDGVEELRLAYDTPFVKPHLHCPRERIADTRWR